MQLTKDTPILSQFFNRYHHYILTAICLLFIAVSLIITSCNTSKNVDSETEEKKRLEILKKQ